MEKIEMIMLSESQIKKTELNLLNIFSDFCKRYHLRYYLAYGTLLGAVRHNGFIPWDDDIDVVMKRDDYDKMQAILKEKNNTLQDNIILKTPSSQNYPYPYCKLYDVSTLIYENNIKRKYPAAIWIDIFPLDKVPEKQKDRERFINQLLRNRKFYFYTIEKRFSGGNLINKIKYYIIKELLTPLFFFLKEKIALDNKARKYENTNSTLYFSLLGGDPINALIHKDDFVQDNFIFEGKEYTSFKNYDKILSCLYGDYLTLPPISERSHHNLIAWKKEPDK